MGLLILIFLGCLSKVICQANPPNNTVYLYSQASYAGARFTAPLPSGYDCTSIANFNASSVKIYNGGCVMLFNNEWSCRGQFVTITSNSPAWSTITQNSGGITFGNKIGAYQRCFPNAALLKTHNVFQLYSDIQYKGIGYQASIPAIGECLTAELFVDKASSIKVNSAYISLHDSYNCGGDERIYTQSTSTLNIIDSNGNTVAFNQKATSYKQLPMNPTGGQYYFYSGVGYTGIVYKGNIPDMLTIMCSNVAGYFNDKTKSVKVNTQYPRFSCLLVYANASCKASTPLKINANLRNLTAAYSGKISSYMGCYQPGGG